MKKNVLAVLQLLAVMSPLDIEKEILKVAVPVYQVVCLSVLPEKIMFYSINT